MTRTRTHSLIGVSAAALVALAAVWPNPAQAADPIARFDGGIGSQPLRAGGLVNDVFLVPPGGRPWVVADLRADFRANGSFSVDGKGLLLGGGNAIGGTAGQSVLARLYCNGVPHNSDVDNPVLLDPSGDFRIRGFLTPTPPAICVNPVLLILNGTGAAWFAAGIPKL